MTEASKQKWMQKRKDERMKGIKDEKKERKKKKEMTKKGKKKRRRNP